MKKLKDAFPYILATLISVGELAMIGTLLYIWIIGVSTENESIINLIYGLLLAYHSAFIAVVSYFYGSTKGSGEKNEMLFNSRPAGQLEEKK